MSNNQPPVPPPADQNRYEPAPGMQANASVPGAPEASSKSKQNRNILIGVAASISALAIGGGAFAVGAAVGRDDPRPGNTQSVSGQQTASQQATPQPVGTHRGERPDETHSAGSHSATTHTPKATNGTNSAQQAPAADAQSLRKAAETAITSVNGSGATSVSVKNTGYQVDVLLADGTDVEVFVAADGQTTRGDQSHDRDAEQPLDLARIGDITAAALSAATAAGGGAGTIDSVSTSNDRNGVAYEASVRLDNGQKVDVKLAADLSPVRTDFDD